MTKKLMILMTLALVIALVFGAAMPAGATRVGAVAFVATANLPAFPCPAGCQVSSLSGPVVGAIARTAPTGVTVCATCTLSLGTAGITYSEPNCVAGEVPLQGSADGVATVNGGTTVGGASTPLDLNIHYVRIGALAVITFTGGQTGAAVGLFAPAGVPGCDGSPQTVRIIGVGAAVGP